MTKLIELSKLYELKRIDRLSTNGNRKESVAEHSWSCLILADYFLSKILTKLNKQKVYDLLIYHDIEEIEIGDTPLHPNIKNENSETTPNLNFLKELPKTQSTKISELHKEYRERKTPEAKFATAIDKLDPLIQGLDHKEKWTNWTEEFIRKHKEKYFEDFPEIKKEFNELLRYLNQEKYFNQ